MNGRVYDPYTARFLSADPYVTNPANGQSFNRYSYVWNNPTNLVDPTGFAVVTITGDSLSAQMEWELAYQRGIAAVRAAGQAVKAAGVSIAKNPGLALKTTVVTVIVTMPGNAGTRDHAGEMGWDPTDDGKRLFTPEQIEALRKDSEEAKSGDEAGPQDANGTNSEGAKDGAKNDDKTNPYKGPVDQPVVVVDQHGNAIPVKPGEQVKGSPNGDYQQVLGPDGKPTGDRLDRGGHKNQNDPRAQEPHGHRPGVTTPDGNPHLPIYH